VPCVDCPCEPAGCDGTTPCNPDQAASLESVACWLMQVRAMLGAATPPDLSPRLVRRHSKLMLALKRSERGVRRLRRALGNRPPRAKVLRRLRKIENALNAFMVSLERGRQRNQIASPLYDRVNDAASRAIDITGRMRT
jgi:hypothetical protein